MAVGGRGVAAAHDSSRAAASKSERWARARELSMESKRTSAKSTPMPHHDYLT